MTFRHLCEMQIKKIPRIESYGDINDQCLQPNSYNMNQFKFLRMEFQLESLLRINEFDDY